MKRKPKKQKSNNAAVLCCIMCVADILRLKAVSAGVVVIKGEATGRYLAMNRNGRLCGVVSWVCFFFILQFNLKTHF